MKGEAENSPCFVFLLIIIHSLVRYPAHSACAKYLQYARYSMFIFLCLPACLCVACLLPSLACSLALKAVFILSFYFVCPLLFLPFLFSFLSFLSFLLFLIVFPPSFVPFVLRSFLPSFLSSIVPSFLRSFRPLFLAYCLSSASPCALSGRGNGQLC